MTVSVCLKLLLLELLLPITLSSQEAKHNGVTLSRFLKPAISRQDDDDEGSALINVGELLIPALAVGIVSVACKLNYRLAVDRVKP